MLDLLPEQTSFELAAAVLLHDVPHIHGYVSQPEPASDQTEPQPPKVDVSLIRDICQRLRLSNHETDRICWLVENQHHLEGASHFSLARLKRLLAQPFIDELITLARVEVLARNGDLNSVLFCEDYLQSTPAEEINPPPLIGGDDLIQLGLQPGPQFKQLLETVRDAQLNNQIHTRDEALSLVRQLTKSKDGNQSEL